MERSVENVANKTTLPSFADLGRHDSLTIITKSKETTHTIDTVTSNHGIKTQTADLGKHREGKKQKTRIANQILDTSRRRMKKLITIPATARATKTSSNTSA
jgi:hypothetical protein